MGQLGRTFENEMGFVGAGEKQTWKRRLKHESDASGSLRVTGERSTTGIPRMESDLEE